MTCISTALYYLLREKYLPFQVKHVHVISIGLFTNKKGKYATKNNICHLFLNS